jgi:hypothetical protein
MKKLMEMRKAGTKKKKMRRMRRMKMKKTRMMKVFYF